jgi:hypothetical protein
MAQVMPRQHSRVPLRLALLLLGAIGLALIIIGLGGNTGWLLIVVGMVALLVSLPGIYVICAPDIETASKAIGRGRGVTFRQDQSDPGSRDQRS